MIQFHHVALSVDDLQRSIDWYGAAFGTETTMEATLPGFRLAMLEGPGNVRLEVFEVDEATRTVDSSTPTSIMRYRGFTHMAVTTDQLVDDYDRLVGLGGVSVWDPRPAPEPGRAMAFIQDPDGNLIELMGPLTDEIKEKYPDGHTTK
jgi:catechol 2,3-dioxygenase-like lactoylglutathione lyase family enzyme